MTLTRSRHKRKAEKASGAPRTAERRPPARVGAEDAAPPPTTLPTPERVARAGGALTRGDTGAIQFKQAPLDLLHSRGRLTDAAFDAGERYREHWYASGLSGLASSGFEPVIRGESCTPWLIPTSERASFFRDEWRQAHKALRNASAMVASIVGSVVLDEAPLLDAGRAYTGKMERSAAITAASNAVREGLDLLAKHYGLDGRRR